MVGVQVAKVAGNQMLRCQYMMRGGEPFVNNIVSPLMLLVVLNWQRGGACWGRGYALCVGTKAGPKDLHLGYDHCVREERSVKMNNHVLSQHRLAEGNVDDLEAVRDENRRNRHAGIGASMG